MQGFQDNISAIGNNMAPQAINAAVQGQNIQKSNTEMFMQQQLMEQEKRKEQFQTLKNISDLAGPRLQQAFLTNGQTGLDNEYKLISDTPVVKSWLTANGLKSDDIKLIGNKSGGMDLEVKVKTTPEIQKQIYNKSLQYTKTGVIYDGEYVVMKTDPKTAHVEYKTPSGESIFTYAKKQEISNESKLSLFNSKEVSKIPTDFNRRVKPIKDALQLGTVLEKHIDQGTSIAINEVRSQFSRMFGQNGAMAQYKLNLSKGDQDAVSNAERIYNEKVLTGKPLRPKDIRELKNAIGAFNKEQRQRFDTEMGTYVDEKATALGVENSDIENILKKEKENYGIQPEKPKKTVAESIKEAQELLKTNPKNAQEIRDYVWQKYQQRI